MKHGWTLLTTEMVVSVWDLINAALSGMRACHISSREG